MGRRGRPPTLKDRKTTSVSLENVQAEFVIKKGIDLSKFVRDNIDALMQSEESPIDQLRKEIIELKQEIQEREVLVRQKEIRIQELEDMQAEEEREGKLLSELDAKRRSYLIEYKNNVKRDKTCSRLWLEHLLEAHGFATFDEAKTYARNVWIETGMSEKTANTFLRMN